MCIDAVPWGSMNPHRIKQAIVTGEALSADPSVPQPYYDLLVNLLKPRAEERTCSLQDLRYTLRSELKVISSQLKNTHIMHHTLLQCFSLNSDRYNSCQQVNITKRNAISARLYMYK